MYSSALNGKFCICQLGSFGLEFKSAVSLLIFCLYFLSIIVNGGIEVFCFYLLLSISAFKSVSICFIYLSVLMLDAYTFITAISSC